MLSQTVRCSMGISLASVRGTLKGRGWRQTSPSVVRGGCIRSLEAGMSAALPLKRASSTGTATTHQRDILSRGLGGRSHSLACDGVGNSELPPLVLIGSAQLMDRSPEVVISEIKSPEFQGKLRQLKECMIEYGGIGIAGPQVGWYKRVFCLGLFKQSERYPEFNPQTLPFQYWINPTVTPDQGNGQTWFWEGCLSVPGVRGWVERPDAIVVSGLNEDGEFASVTLKGITARVFQHEFDHLDGVLFPSRVKDPSHLVPVASFAAQSEWAEDWPTPEARQCLPGQLYYPSSG